MPTFSEQYAKRRPLFRYTFITDFVVIDELPHAPKGWDGALINWARSDTYFGMIRTFTVPVSYVKDGAYLLRKAFYGDPLKNKPGQLTQANVQVKIERFIPSTFSWEIIFLGDNDFSTIEDHGPEEGDIVTVNVMESGITRYVKAYEDVKYTIPIPTSGPDSHVITMTPIKLNEYAQFIFLPYPNTVEDGYPGLQLVNNDQKALVASVKSVDNTPAPPPNFATEGSWFYQATTNTTVHVKGTGITGDFGRSIGLTTCDISIYKQDNSVAYTLLNQTGGLITGFNLNFETSITVNSGDKLFLFVKFTGTPARINITDGELDLEYNVESIATDVNAVTGKYLFQQLMNLMNSAVPGSPVPTRSYHLDVVWANLLFTSGNAIKPFTPSLVYSDGTLDNGVIYRVLKAPVTYNGRNYGLASTFTANATPKFFGAGYVKQDINTPFIIISWKQFFNSLNAITNIGWGVQNGVSVLEAKSYWYQANPQQTIKVGNVAKFKATSATSMLYSSVKYGYDDQDYDQFNGSVEINSTAFASFPTNRVNKVLDLTSSIRADSMGIELLRVGINQAASGGSSTQSNNDTFTIYCVPGGTEFIPEPAQTFGNLTGISTNIYNLRLSPKACLLRHADYLASILYGFSGSNIVFQSGMKNVNLSRIDGGVVITENANIGIGSLGTPLFIPINVTMTIKEPFDMVNMLSNFSTGAITAINDGVPFDGFISDCNTDVAFNTQQEVKVLLTPNNNLLNFTK